jgi:hypothetical protein
MNDAPAQRALSASAIALVVAVALLALLLPPMVERTSSSVTLMVLVGMALATAILLHWVFLGIAASRMQLSVPGWVSLGALFPIGGATALMLLAWFADEARLDAART